jgi:hypothetical protein
MASTQVVYLSFQQRSTSRPADAWFNLMILLYLSLRKRMKFFRSYYFENSRLFISYVTLYMLIFNLCNRVIKYDHIFNGRKVIS